MPDVLITKVCHLVETDISIARTYLEVLLFLSMNTRYLLIT